MTIEEALKAAVDAVAQLGKDVGIPAKLSDVGVREEDIQFLADVCTGGNPKDTSVEEIVELYKTML